MPIDPKFNLQNLPPKGDKDVASFFDNLFEIARAEKERLKKHEDFLANYALYRGRSATDITNRKIMTPVNLYFANVERTVSNITARVPVGEVVDLDGTSEDGVENIFTMKLKKWWKDSNQQKKTRATARTMEIYGITVEKPTWNKDKENPIITITDPFAFFPAPGNWENIDEDAPYICFAYLKFVSEVEKDFNVKNVAPDDAYDLLGASREEYSSSDRERNRIGNYADAMTVSTKGVSDKTYDKKVERCLIKEIWVRDDRTKSVTEDTPIIDPTTGMSQLNGDGLPLINRVVRKEKIYPDGIRKVTIVQSKGEKDAKKGGYIVLDDSPNPNINPELDVELASNTYPWGRLPVYIANSYRDLVSIWGFAAAEQVGDLIYKINQIVSKLISYVINVMAPPLIVQQHCGITKAMIEENLKKSGRLILMPTTPNARIEFLSIPNLPATFFQVLDLIIKLFDRIYQIEDADRGQAPKGVIAASAIVALQERNQVLMQAKTSAIDALVEARSRWAIGLWQNFGVNSELVEVAGEPVEFIGTRYAGRKFSYVVESGSTTPRTSLQVQEQAQKLYEMGAIDRQALLENLNFPSWQEIIERSSEGQVGQALQILIAAGLPEEDAIQIQQYVMQPGQGPGGSKTEGQSTEAKTAQPGVPRGQQGEAT